MSRGAGLDSQTPSQGSELIFARPGELIDALRNRTAVLALGARLLTGLRGIGTVGLPKLSASAEAEWIGENPASDVGESNPTTDLVDLKPQTLVATTSFSRELLQQATPSVDRLVIDDVGQVNAVALDRAAIHGAGGDAPTGVYS